MKLTAGIYNLKQLNKFIDFLDCAILYTNYSQLGENLDIDRAISLCRNHDVTPILGLNKLLYPNDISDFRAYVEKYIPTNCLFYVSDFGALNICKELNIASRVIFDPETMITNYLDANEYYEFGPNAVGISSEIPAADVKEICEKSKAKLFYQIFGSRQMMKSRRHLVSLYNQKANISAPSKALLREATREDFFPIIENDNGTFIFRSGYISLIDCYDEIINVEYGYVEALNIAEDVLLKALDTIYGLKSGLLTKEEAIKEIEELNINTPEGFKYKDSVYQKEEF